MKDSSLSPPLRVAVPAREDPAGPGSHLKGALILVALVVNTLWWCLPLFVLSLVKLAIPVPAFRARLDRGLNALARGWVACNGAWIRLHPRMRWVVRGAEGLSRQEWYLVQANHQSWADIFVLQRVLGPRIPLMKFFLKRALIYVPVIGLAWWALDFPFMRRAGAAQGLARRQEDARTARVACGKFARTPTSVANFPEGTRFTGAKHATQDSPYRHLLKPKAGALQAAVQVLGSRVHSLLDVTIVYPEGAPSFWDFLRGAAPLVVVDIRQRPIPAAVADPSQSGDPRATRAWLEAMWSEKDALVARTLDAFAPPSLGAR